MIANPSIEQMEREAMSDLQLKKLQKQMRWAMEKSAFYYRKFTKAGLDASSIQSLEDVAKLPFTTDDELNKTSVYNMLTLPLSAVLRIARVGNGQPLVRMYTNGDLAYQIEMMTRVLAAQDLHGAMVVGLMGESSDSRVMDVQYALENMGMTTVIMGNDPEVVRDMLTHCHIDVLISDLKQVTQLLVVLQAGGVDLEALAMPQIICMEESVKKPNRRHIEQRFNTKVTTSCGFPALGCGGILFPCGHGRGFHVQEDYFYPEIVEPDTGKVITEADKTGELVLTALAAEAVPVFRYRTGQKIMKVGAPCTCGRTLMKVVSEHRPDSENVAKR